MWDFTIVLDPQETMDQQWMDVTSSQFTLEFMEPPDISVFDIEVVGNQEDGSKLEIVVYTNNDGSTQSAGTLTLSIDGTPIETIAIVLSADSRREDHLFWKAEEGKHTITATIVVAADSDLTNNSRSITLTIDPQEEFEVDPVVLAVSSVTVLGALLIIFTESGRYNFLKFMVLPFYTRLKRGKVLDHFMRGQVYGFIKANPGAHYNLIRRKLEINNGALAYHISVLEREKFIRSRMDGTLKRFYPSDMNIPTGHELTEMERRIIDVIRANPGFSQKEVALTLGLSPQVINYHIKSLGRNHILKLTRVGKRTLCYLSDDVELDF